ncbi:ABC transporter substrate-binding protein [Nocardioides sp. AE5]|uniref:ABC transporter substrate-binding protein n=1 Tax=Nocardioides sp. AE5 TaxID=2962573 RepID=UPI002881B563|nr:ABC transporter substrate-binding protein [Nocardioides sp. AE5]MDT0203930.1 ABC transporter substrate-binding protein [Nocardioides sp. AE5]
MSLIFDTLVDGELDGSLNPGLATEWSISDDAQTVDFTLREGVTFQDGTPFNADAVVATMDHFMESGSLLAGALSMIDTVEAVDDTHVRFVTNRPAGDLPNVMAGFAGMIVSPASLEAGTTSTDPVGAGPFTVSEVTDSNITFDYWDGYWAADQIIPRGVEVSIYTDDSARMNALKSGQIDAALIRPNQMAEADAAGLMTYDEAAPTAYGLAINADHPVLGNAEVRKAISNAIDRESISEFLLDGRCTVTAQPYPKEHVAHDDSIDEAPYVAYDPDGARATIAAAVPGGLSLTILAPNVTAYQRLAEVLQDQLSDVGIETKVEVIDYADLLGRQRAGDYELIVTLLTSSGPDVATWAEQNYVVRPGSGEFIDPQIPEFIAESRSSVDPAVRAEAFGKITETALNAGTNQVVVCLPSNTFASAANVTGFKSNDPRRMNVP